MAGVGDLAAIAIALAAFAIFFASIWLIGKVDVGAADIAGLIVAVALFFYLGYALFRAERF